MTTSNIVITLVNTGTERTNMSVAIDGNTKEGSQITVSRKGIETLRGVIDMGTNFSAPADKVEQSLTSRLKGFPNGEDVLNYLEMNGVSVTDYVNHAITTLADAKVKEPTAGRAKKGDGYKVKQTKFAVSTAVKLACRFAEASSDGTLTDDMFLLGYQTALETLKNLDETIIVAEAKKLAETRGLDNLGYVRLRGTGDSEDSE